MQQDFEEIIRKGIQGLPKEQLKEIAEFIFFIRQKALNPTFFQEKIAHALLLNELELLDADESRHLEAEFERYKEQYPKE